jgi:hypothetical protein
VEETGPGKSATTRKAVSGPHTPARAGGLLEEQQRADRTLAATDEDVAAELRQRHGWQIVAPSPL